MRLELSLMFFFAFFSIAAMGNEPIDSLSSKNSIFLVPLLSYQQETDWSFGVTGAYYFKSKHINRISYVTGSTTYTLNKQFTFNLSPRIYLNNNKWFINSNLKIENYPNYFYGIGNKPTNIQEKYTNQNITFFVQPLYALSSDFFAGLVVSGNYVKILDDSVPDTYKNRKYGKYSAVGWNPFGVLSFGGVIMFDKRNSQFYPTKGIFLKTTASVSGKNIGSTYSLIDFSIDYRQFFSIYNTHIIALQFYSTGVFGKKIPFEMLPTIGGSEYIRGFRQRKFTDNIEAMIQTEYRFPIYKKLRGTLFYSAGDVYNSYYWSTYKPKVGYGAGLRYELNDAKVNLRFDIARTNYNNDFQFYFTASEAF